MIFIELHEKGKLSIVRVDEITSVRHPIRGSGGIISLRSENDVIQVDESVDDILEMLTVIEVELEEIANDE